MSGTKLRILAPSALAIVLIFAPLPGSVSRAAAQETAPSASSQDSGAMAPKAHKGQHRDDEGKLIEEEEEGKADPNKVFKHSPSVRAIARITGLSIDQTYWLCTVLNFAIIFGGLWFLLRKVIPAAFQGRSDAIKLRLEDARKTGEEARRRLSEVETRLSRLDSEIEQMRREAEASGADEEKRVMAGAEDERRRIVESAEQEIARAANAARRELKAYAAELGVNLAEAKIRITDTTDQELVREFASRLGRNGN